MVYQFSMRTVANAADAAEVIRHYYRGQFEVITKADVLAKVASSCRLVALPRR